MLCTGVACHSELPPVSATCLVLYYLKGWGALFWDRDISISRLVIVTMFFSVSSSANLKIRGANVIIMFIETFCATHNSAGTV